MRRLFVAISACVGLICLAQARPGPDSNYNRSVSGGGGFTPSCTQSSNFLARATGITLTADKTNYDTLICGMVTDGTFAKMDALYIFAAPDSTTALLNLIQNSFNGTTGGTVSFSAYHGFTGNATNFVINTGFTPSTGGSQYVLNSASLGVYVLTSSTADTGYSEIGSNNNAGSYIIPRDQFGNGAKYTANDNSAGAGVTNANVHGFYSTSRTASTAHFLYKNGSQLDTQSITSTTLDNVTLSIFAVNSNPNVGFSGSQQSAAFIGGGLSSTDETNLSNRVNAFMTAYGINVY